MSNFSHHHLCTLFLLSLMTGIANENGGITFFPVQVNVGGQAQPLSSSIQPLSAQTLAGTLSPQQTAGTALQLQGPLAVQQVALPGEQRHRQQQGSSGARTRKAGSLALFFRKVLLSNQKVRSGSPQSAEVALSSVTI